MISEDCEAERRGGRGLPRSMRPSVDFTRHGNRESRPMDKSGGGGEAPLTSFFELHRPDRRPPPRANRPVIGEAVSRLRRRAEACSASTADRAVAARWSWLADDQQPQAGGLFFEGRHRGFNPGKVSRRSDRPARARLAFSVSETPSTSLTGESATRGTGDPVLITAETRRAPRDDRGGSAPAEKEIRGLRQQGRVFATLCHVAISTGPGEDVHTTLGDPVVGGLGARAGQGDGLGRRSRRAPGGAGRAARTAQASHRQDDPARLP